jgi:hypothetical protein
MYAQAALPLRIACAQAPYSAFATPSQTRTRAQLMINELAIFKAARALDNK